MRIVENPTLFRETIRTTLNSKLHNESTALIIENGIYNYTIQECTNRKIIKKWNNPFFVELYVSKFKTLLFNIETDHVQELIRKDPYKIATMSHQEMNPTIWKPFIEKEQKIAESMLNNKLTANTTSFKCYRCDSKNCSYYQMQIRSADEPMTSFVTCIDCDNHWRVN
jgi:transcription elongation factor S-II